MEHPDDDEAVVNDAGQGRAIRTPDQRLRVFVSSTLRELEPERRAARDAIEKLRLAPVMFELGARPHPPREVYRAYLEQSDVFVGIYWQQYGWIAPDETVSGLEDEYRLARHDMPRLIYLKQPANRHERLDSLLARIRDDDTASYKSFSTASELGLLIEADLATLLAERFDASRAPAMPDTADDGPTGRLPAPFSELVGREGDVATLLAWLDGGVRRLVTLVGPGGIGKSRLALEVARLAQDRFDRVTFIALEHVRDPEKVLPAVARELGVRGGGDRPLTELLAIARAGRRDLLVLDNFEQVLAAAPLLSSLLTELPGATFLVTSRARLRLRGEYVFDVDPLGVLPEPATASLREILDTPSVQLFQERAQAADPRFRVTADNAEHVALLCRALDGVPLALELAAARIRALPPATILAKLDRVLPLLVTDARDVPERQRTISATVEWSIRLLSADAQSLFARLGVFVGTFSLDAVEAVAVDESWAADLLGTLLELIDSSLLRQHDVQGVPFFSMLAPVREIAADRFSNDPDAAVARRRHAEHYVRLAHETEPLLQGATQPTALIRLEAERDNLRSGYRYLISTGDVDSVAGAVWSLLLYWWIRTLLPEARAWMEEILGAGVPLTDRTRAIAIAFSSWVALSQPGTAVDPEPVEQSVALFHRAGDAFGEACALTVLCIALMSASPADLERAETVQKRAIELASGYPSFAALFRGALGTVQLVRGRAAEALETFDAVIDEAVRIGDRFIESITLTNAGWARLALGEARPDLFVQHLRLSLEMGNEDGIGYAFEGLSACAALTGDSGRAGVLLGAAETARKRTGMIEQRSYMTLLRPLVDTILGTDEAARFEAERARGRSLSRRDALDLVLEPATDRAPCN